MNCWHAHVVKTVSFNEEHWSEGILPMRQLFSSVEHSIDLPGSDKTASNFVTQKPCPQMEDPVVGTIGHGVMSSTDSVSDSESTPLRITSSSVQLQFVRSGGSRLHFSGEIRPSRPAISRSPQLTPGLSDILNSA